MRPAVVRDAAESVLRELVGRQTFADLLTGGSRGVPHRGAGSVAATLRRLRTTRLGVRLEGLSLTDLHPPQEVVEAYHQVTTAMEKRDERVNQATAEALSSGSEQQEAESLQRCAWPKPRRLDKVRRAEAMRDAVTARVRARKALAWDQEWDLLRGAVLEAWNNPLSDDAAASLSATPGGRDWLGRRC